MGAQLLSGRVLDSRTRSRGFEPHRRHCVVSLSKIHLSLLSTGSTQEDLSRHNWKKCGLGHKESNQTKMYFTHYIKIVMCTFLKQSVVHVLGRDFIAVWRRCKYWIAVWKNKLFINSMKIKTQFKKKILPINLHFSQFYIFSFKRGQQP